MDFDVLQKMNTPQIDKVARRRSVIAIVISLISLWISIEGIDAVRANFLGLAATSFITLPLILIYVGAIFALLYTPKLIKWLMKHQSKDMIAEADDCADGKSKT